MAWGAIAISVLASIIFVVAFSVAYFSHDTNSLSLLVGATIANFTTAVSYWLGSSSGSQKKDDRLGRIAEGQPDSPPKDKTS